VKAEGGRRAGAGRACCSSATWRLICPYDPPARVQAAHAHRNKARQLTLRRAPQPRSMLTRPPPRLAAMGDGVEEGAEVETEEEHRRLRIREIGTPT